jgi:tetrahydromethanopterin S-methyltransferase subunit C
LVGLFVSLLGGIVTFVAVALGVTAALDPYIWPSALVGLPVGAVAGVSVAVLANHVLTTRREQREGRGGTPGT